MSAGKRLFPIVFICLSASLLVVGCGGDGGCGCDLPLRVSDWLIDVDLGYIPEEITEYPVTVGITVHISNLENGGPAPDGLVVALAVAPGSFDNGLAEIEQPVANGRVHAVLVADAAALYTLTIGIRGESASATTTFSVGL